MNSFVVGGASNLTVDWMVISIGGGVFAYMYQLENTTTRGIDLFTVAVPAGSVIAAGVLAGDDLDLVTTHPDHDAATFPILAGEEEGLPLAPLAGVAAVISATDVTWTFAPLAAGSESDTLWFTSYQLPVYGSAVAMNGSPPSPWGSLAAGSDSVPVPQVPEPATLLLLGSGLLGAAAWRERRRR